MDAPHGFHLEKNLPVASGIGGGSADAAAALRLLVRATGRPLPDGTELGADVPACLLSKPLRMGGIGEKLTLLPALPDFAMVLANAGAPVSTPEVFKALASVDNPASPPLPAGLTQDGFFGFIREQRNDMQQAAIQITPSISKVLAALSGQKSCALARMSGSGGTSFGLFKTLAAAQQAAADIQQQNPSWWVAAAQV